LLNPVWNDDLAVAFALAAESAETGVFHAAGPDLLTLRAFLELTGEIVGCPPQIEELDRPCDQRHAGGFAETTARLGYLPRVDLREGIRRIAAEIATTEQEGACKS
jgi:nucleoside-diphosphate-sugar epimerase